MSDEQDQTSSAQSLRNIGKVAGIHGLKGELYVYVFSKDVSWIDGLSELILENPKGEQSILKIESLRPFKDGFLVFIAGVTDRNEAENHRGKLVYVDAELFVTDDEDDSFYLAEIEGFKVFDKDKLLGTITGFSSNTAQDLLIVEGDGLKVEIPLVEEFLSAIDFDKQEVRMNLPEGLVESQQESEK